MFFKSLVLFQKVTTNLTGLDVVFNPQNVLKKTYKRILDVLSEMPDDSYYKISTEKIIKKRMEFLDSPDIDTIEQKINCGQIEEVILQAKNELNLAKNMLNWKPWEPLKEQPLENQWKWPI